MAVVSLQKGSGKRMKVREIKEFRNGYQVATLLIYKGLRD